MPPAQIPSEQRFILPSVPWRTYQRLLRAFADRPGVRLTYDRGILELRTLSHEHESYGRFLGRLAVTLTEELGLPVKEGGSTTLRRRRKRRGLEPDNCYWIQNEARMRGKKKFDPGRDPAPDLALEVDITDNCLEEPPWPPPEPGGQDARCRCRFGGPGSSAGSSTG